MLRPRALCFAVLAVLVVESRAAEEGAEPACELSEPEPATVASVIDGETLKLADGRIVRLIGAKAPAPPLGLQQEMVSKGLARVYSLPDNRACAAPLLAREKEARAKQRGVWGSFAYRIQDATDLKRLGRLTHSYQLVEGTVVGVGEGRGRLYLNFAEDWRSDFTIDIERKNAGAFAAAGIDLKSLAGSRVRVRGWLQWRNGPTIEATHPEQLEVLPDRALPPS